jgi:hypothetical protein
MDRCSCCGGSLTTGGCINAACMSGPGGYYRDGVKVAPLAGPPPSMNPGFYMRRHKFRELRDDLPDYGSGHIGGWCEDCGNISARATTECPGRPKTRQ